MDGHARATQESAPSGLALPLRNASEPPGSETGSDVSSAQGDEGVAGQPPAVEDAIATLFTCANWAIQVYVAVLLNEDPAFNNDDYAWVAIFVGVPLAANIAAVVGWLMQSPAKGFLQRLEVEPDVNVLVLVLGTISTDALALLSTRDQDRATVRCLGLGSNLLADVPFLAITLRLILSGQSRAIIVACALLNLLSIAVKMTRNWIILILSYNRWRRYRRVRACLRAPGQNFHIEDALTLPFSLAFWVLALFFTATLSLQPLFTPALAPGLDTLRRDWERVLVECYYGAVAAFFANLAANGLLWTSYLLNPRFAHSWMHEKPLTTSLIGMLGLVDGCAFNALTQNDMWYERVLANGLLARLVCFELPFLLIAWHAHATLNHGSCTLDPRCEEFAGGNIGAFVYVMPACVMISAWWKLYRLVVSHATAGTHGADVDVQWRDADLHALSPEMAFAFSLQDRRGVTDEDKEDIEAIQAEADEEELVVSAQQAHGEADGGKPSALRGGSRQNMGGSRQNTGGSSRARSVEALAAIPALRDRHRSLLFGAHETPDADLTVVEMPADDAGDEGRGRRGGGRGGRGKGKRGRDDPGSDEEDEEDGREGRDRRRRGGRRGGNRRRGGDDDDDGDGDDDDDAARDPETDRARRSSEDTPPAARGGTSDDDEHEALAKDTRETPGGSMRQGGGRRGSASDKRASLNGPRRKGRGRARGRKSLKGGNEPVDEDRERKRQERLHRGRNKKARRRDNGHHAVYVPPPTIAYAIWENYSKAYGGSRWVGQAPVAALCVANLVRRLTFVTDAWQIKEESGEANSVAQAAIGMLAFTALLSSVLAAWAMRRGAAPQVKAALNAQPLGAVLALTVATAHPELPAALAEGWDALALTTYSIAIQDVPWLVLDAFYIARFGWGPLSATMPLQVTVASWKLCRAVILWLSRRSPPEITSEFFRFTRMGDFVPVIFSAIQFGLLLALTLHVYWLRFRGENSFAETYDITVGPSYSAATDMLMYNFLQAAIIITAAAVVTRLGVIVYFLRHDAFSHRGIYRHSMLSSVLAIVSCLEGSAFTALAKSNVSYKVFKLATSICGLVVFDLPSTLLIVVYYFALVDFNQVGVTFGDYLVEDLLRASAIVCILCVLFKVFMLTLMKATLQDSAGVEENPFVGPACLGCAGNQRGQRTARGRNDEDEDEYSDDEDRRI